MIALVGYWDMGYNSPLREKDRWYYLLSDLNVDNWHMIPVSGINEPKLTEYETIEEIFALYPNVPAVFVDETATESLEDFVHPTDAIYVFGKTAYSPLGHKREGDSSILINTPHVGGLWGDQAAAIILYDRLIKST